MPAQECVWLNNMKSLFPEPGTAGEQNQTETVTVGMQRALDLSIEDNQLLAQQRIFYNQIGTAASQIWKDYGDQGQGGGFSPMFDALFKPKKKRLPDDDAINHAVFSVLCDEDQTA